MKLLLVFLNDCPEVFLLIVASISKLEGADIWSLFPDPVINVAGNFTAPCTECRCIKMGFLLRTFSAR